MEIENYYSYPKDAKYPEIEFTISPDYIITIHSKSITNYEELKQSKYWDRFCNVMNLIQQETTQYNYKYNRR